jgi:hypothetical protein
VFSVPNPTARSIAIRKTTIFLRLHCPQKRPIPPSPRVRKTPRSRHVAIPILQLPLLRSRTARYSRLQSHRRR